MTEVDLDLESRSLRQGKGSSRDSCQVTCFYRDFLEMSYMCSWWTFCLENVLIGLAMPTRRWPLGLFCFYDMWNRIDLEGIFRSQPSSPLIYINCAYVNSSEKAVADLFGSNKHVDLHSPFESCCRTPSTGDNCKSYWLAEITTGVATTTPGAASACACYAVGW